MVEDKLRDHFDYSLGKVEVVIYSVLALLLSVTVLAAIASAGKLLWDALSHWAIATQTLRVLNELLVVRSEEHTSELQSRSDLVCRLLLEKKKKQQHNLLRPPMCISTIDAFYRSSTYMC